ncbi:hypothetical protein N8563_00745 [bacterium]|nr:hypothetical protein [bacterium]
MRMEFRGHGAMQSRRTAVLHPLTGLLEVWGAAFQQAEPLQIGSAASNWLDSRPETLSLHGPNVPLACPDG